MRRYETYYEAVQSLCIPTFHFQVRKADMGTHFLQRRVNSNLIIDILFRYVAGIVVVFDQMLHDASKLYLTSEVVVKVTLA